MYHSLLTLETISLYSAIIVNLILIIVILMMKDKVKNNYFFLGFITAILTWTVSSLLYLTTSGSWLVFSAKLFYFSGCSIPIFIILFTQTLGNQDLGFSKSKIALFLTGPIMVCLSAFLPNGVVKDVIIDQFNDRAIIFGPLYVLVFTYIVIIFTLAFILMFFKYRKASGIEKTQMGIVFSSIFLSSVAALAVSLIMPSFGNFSLFWGGSFFSCYTLIMIVYAIIQYGLFDIKLAATEFMTLGTWSLLLTQILFFNKSLAEQIINGAVFIVVVLTGILIIRAVKKETYLREKDDELVTNISNLNYKLEKTNVELKELDRKKSEFISLATHQLRAPLTSMKGYTSMLLDGTFGDISNPEMKDAIEKISRSTNDLTMIVEDYLDVSRIEQGRMQYNFSVVSLVSLIKDVISEVKPAADRAGLEIKLTYDEAVQYNISVDSGKMKQVFLNIIDNAIKYTPHGHIYIFVEKIEDNKVRVKIEDTGVGINSEVLPTLFNKFVQAPDASKINILGTGLGLYVAGEIIKAHAGKAWGESAGEGKGSTFYVELALA